MSWGHIRVVCAIFGLQAGCAQAQDAEALTRTQRDADNPLRMIIEASKLKPRQKTVESEAVAKPPAEKLPPRQAIAKPAPAVAAQALPATLPPERSLAAAPVATPEPGPPSVDKAPAQASIEPPAPMDAGAQAPLPPAETSAEVPNSSAAPSSPSAAELQAPTLLPAVASASPMPMPMPNPPRAPVTMQLADYVEPVLPDRVRRRLQNDGEVVVGFTVNPDGSVADAAVRSSSDRSLDAVALEAVRRWRYAPIVIAQPHAVQLVFRLRE